MFKSRCFVLFAALFVLVNMCYAAGTSPLAEKLIAGSPWVFTTKYEETKQEFRYNSEGVFERKSSGDWREVKIEEGDKIIRKTKNGHTITIQLDENGNPTATHSKHSSSFRSMK